MWMCPIKAPGSPGSGLTALGGGPARGWDSFRKVIRGTAVGTGKENTLDILAGCDESKEEKGTQLNAINIIRNSFPAMALAVGRCG